jgi:hypothetical protein
MAFSKPVSNIIRSPGTLIYRDCFSIFLGSPLKLLDLTYRVLLGIMPALPCDELGFAIDVKNKIISHRDVETNIGLGSDLLSRPKFVDLPGCLPDRSDPIGASGIQNILWVTGIDPVGILSWERSEQLNLRRAMVRVLNMQTRCRKLLRNRVMSCNCRRANFSRVPTPARAYHGYVTTTARDSYGTWALRQGHAP